MRSVFSLCLVFLFALAVAAQKPDEVLATATGHTFRLSDLSPDIQKDVANLPSAIAKARSALMEQLINQKVAAAEAKARGISLGKLLADEKAKVPNPSAADIQKVYDDNRGQIGNATLEQMRSRIVAFLRGQPEQKAVSDMIVAAKAKYKVVLGKDVNAAGLLPTDVVATVNGEPITAKQFDEWAQVQLFEAKGELTDALLDELDEAIFNALVADEAKAAGIDSGAFIAREVTNKMKDFTDAERQGLMKALTDRLWQKYQVKLLYGPPESPLENVTVDDDPATGPATAPVTVIMFSDFQCSACSGTHPLLKQAMAAYPGKIRFVVRDFPLESIHGNAWIAARAASAANAQGKFFEYIEILYKNQDHLDPDSLKKYAAQVGLNAQQFEVDFNSEKVAAEIRKDMADGDALGINSTPTIFVNRRRVRDLSLEGFKRAIDRALAGK